jgi:hypothetical protein
MRKKLLPMRKKPLPKRKRLRKSLHSTGSNRESPADILRGFFFGKFFFALTEHLQRFQDAAKQARIFELRSSLLETYGIIEGLTTSNPKQAHY